MTRANFHDGIEEWELRAEELTDPSSRVCGSCVTDTYLWAAVTSESEESACDFCSATADCVDLEALAAVVEDVLDQHYLPVAESGAFHEEGVWSEEVHDVKNILEEFLWNAVAGEVFKPLVDFVASRNAVEYGFVRKRDVWGTLYDFHEGDWRNFMARARAGELEAAAADLTARLDQKVLDLFRQIERTVRDLGLFKTASPRLWRCRPGSAEPGFRSAADLGSAPAEHAGENRMTPEGHSAFYGSTELRGALIEMAHHYGADATMWAGRFTPSNSLYYLDVMKAPDLPSVFAPGAADAYDAIRFFARFVHTVSQPNDGEPRHYLPTQIFVAYLLTATDAERPTAIRFGSSLDPTSENWVVFVDHNHCVDAEIPDGEDQLFMVLEPETLQFLTPQ